MTDWLRRLIGGKQTEDDPSASRAEAEDYLDKVQSKITKLAGDFAQGDINQDQFQELYSHYQREIRMIQTVLDTAPENWEEAVTEGESLLIRRRHQAKALAFAIYVNQTGLPLKTLGQFEVDSEIVISMIASYRSATQEIFGAGMRSTEIANGEWVIFVPGEITTLISLFSNEPAAKQMEFVEELHRLFEQANRPYLSADEIEVGSLLFPHEYFLGEWNQ